MRVNVHDVKGFPLDLDLTVQGDRVMIRVCGSWPVQKFYVHREDAAPLLNALNITLSGANPVVAQSCPAPLTIQ